MPNYDYRCAECGNIFEEHRSVAERRMARCACGAVPELQLGSSQPIIFKEGLYEHLGLKSVYVSSKRQLKDECKKRDLFSPYAWD